MNKKIWVFSAVVFTVMIALISCVVMASQKSEISLTNACIVDFEGYEGEGKAHISCDVDYDYTSKIQSEFVETIEFYIENDGTFKNGDKVILKSRYSQKTAESLNINVTDVEKEMVVTGLIDVYETYHEIPVYQSVYYKQETMNYLRSELKRKAEQNFLIKALDIQSIDFVASYYHFNQNQRAGDMYMLFRVHSIEESLFSIKEKNQYYYVMIQDIHSEKVFQEDLLYKDMSINEVLGNKKRKKDEEAIETLKEIIHNNIEMVEEHLSSKIYEDKEQSKFSSIFDFK